MPLFLEKGSQIAIIGGGPAGCFFAHFAKQFAAKKGLEVEITIFDGKDFNLQGPRGCNLCAGVISENLIRKLEQQGIVLPEGKVQRRIRGYYLQTSQGGFFVPHPDGECKIYTVFRGNGPRFSALQGNVSFDDHLLEHVKGKGVKVIPQPIKDILLPKDPDQRVRLIYGTQEERHEFEADLVVGAFGLNTKLLELIRRLGFGYRPPKTRLTFQAEIPLDSEYIFDRFQNHIFVFNLRELKGVRFAFITPKAHHLTVGIVCERDATPKDFFAFLDQTGVREVLPPDWKRPERYCFCHPKIAVTAARNAFTDRFVLIGDASCSRYYKNGIESAFWTAQWAAKTAFEYGISKAAFRQHYHKLARKRIIRDNFFGRIMFGIYWVVSKVSFLSKVFLHVSTMSTDPETTKRLQANTWNMLTGQVPYQQIFRDFLHPRLQIGMIRATLRVLFGRRGSQEGKGQGILRRGRDGSARVAKALTSGSTVVIIGGGPAGVGCGLALRNMARERGIDLRVVIFEGKTFEGSPHYNQCVGVLSPPIKELLEKDLQIPFPNHLVQRVIKGYILCSDGQAIELPDNGELSLAVRRITFDSYLLEQARRHGIEVIHSRVTDLEFNEEGVRVYSENVHLTADVVVGAFGLDDGTARVFERATRYRQPRFLSSIVTKIHPGMDFMENFGDTIHVFLPPFPKIEFGAITPKRNHLTINIAGAEVNSEWMDRFLEYPPVRQVLPRDFDPRTHGLSYFKGKFPISVARGIYGDRYVIVGDAAGLVRPFKGKGVNAALLSGIRAAQVMMNRGVSREDFKAYYRMNREVTEDLPYGRILRYLANVSANYGFLDKVLEISKREEKLREALLNCVAAHKSFKTIYEETKDARLFIRLLMGVGASLIGIG